MTVFEVIKKRYSCRAYQDKPIEQDKLDQIFEAARQAPSGFRHYQACWKGATTFYMSVMITRPI